MAGLDFWGAMEISVRSSLASLGRQLLRDWARIRVMPGYCYQAIENLGPRLAPESALEARLHGGLRVRCRLQDHVQRAIYYWGCYEPIETYCFIGSLRPDMVVVDAGGNIGQYTLLAARAVGRGGRVHTFEPVPANHERLKEHLQMNGCTNVVLNQVALWNEPGTLEMGLPEEIASDTASENFGSYTVGEHTAGTSFPVPAVRFDDYAAEHGVARVDAVKLDCEGAEFNILQGMVRTIERDRPLLLVELRDDTCRLTNSSCEAIVELLAVRFGYRAWRIGECSELSGEARFQDLRKIRGNVLFFAGDAPPPVLTRQWDLRSCLRWAERA